MDATRSPWLNPDFGHHPLPDDPAEVAACIRDVAPADLPMTHHDEYPTYLAALLEGDARGMGAVVARLLRSRMPWIEVCRDFVQRGLYDVGRMWERNEIPVSVEHLAASASHLVLSDHYLRHRRPEFAPEVIIACVQGEHHEIGVMVVGTVCEAAGRRAVLLGSDTPTHDLVTFIQHRRNRPELLALSITLPANRKALAEGLSAITSRFPSLGIIIGGQALDGSAEALRFRDALLARHPLVSHVPNLEALERFLARLPLK